MNQTNKKTINIMVVHLSSSDPNRLLRGIRASQKLFSTRDMNIDIRFDIHVIVNSKNPEYMQEVYRKIGSNNEVCNIIETPSDGTPGTGKNSVFDYFLRQKKKYDYLFQVDGDDFLYPCALRQLAKLLDENDMPDAVSFQSMDWMSTVYNDKMPVVNIVPNTLWMYSWVESEINLREIPEFKYVTEPDFGTKGRIFTPGTSMILSRKFLTKFRKVRHTNEISLFEDYLFYLKLFHLHVTGQISMVHTNNSFFYVYDKANEVSVSTKNWFYTQKEINLLTSFVRENRIHDKHPKDCLPFVRLGVPSDSFKTEDKIVFCKHMIKKYPVTMRSVLQGKPHNPFFGRMPTMPPGGGNILNTNPNYKGPRILI